MKVLTIRQPWAYAILNLGKDIENRDWDTNYRGVIALHTSKTVRKSEYQMARITIAGITGEKVPPYEDLLHGMIVGVANLVDCVWLSASPWFFGDYGFVLKAATALRTPIAAKGALGLWEVPAELEQAIKDQL